MTAAGSGATPRPFAVYRSEGKHYRRPPFGVRSSDGTDWCFCHSEEQAALIVAAVNAYDAYAALVEAARLADDNLSRNGYTEAHSVRSALRSALAAVEDQS